MFKFITFATLLVAVCGQNLEQAFDEDMKSWNAKPDGRSARIPVRVNVQTGSLYYGNAYGSIMLSGRKQTNKRLKYITDVIDQT